MTQRGPLPRVELLAGPGKCVFQRGGQSQVHVIAAEEQMVADGDPAETEIVPLGLHLNQTEIACPAADITDEDELVCADVALPVLSVVEEPGIERSLRFLDQGDALQAGVAGRLHRQFPGHFVKGGGDRQDHVLSLEAGSLGLRAYLVVPRFADMVQIPCRSLDRGKSFDIFGRAPRKYFCGSVHRRMAEPGLRGGDQPAGHEGATIACELSDGERAFLIPGNLEAAGGQFVGSR